MLELNKIYCMDCIEGLKQIPDNSVDLIVTDPPYNFSSTGAGFVKNVNTFKKIQNSFKSEFIPEPFLNELKRIMKKMNCFIWCNKDLIYNYLKYAVDNHYYYNILMWHKSNPMPLKGDSFYPDTEYCIWIYESNKTWNCQYKDNKLYAKWFITRIGLEGGNGHPTPKPIICFSKFIKLCSNEKDIVVDPFIGSGTCAVACKQLNRQFIGFEINPEYCKIAESRLKQTTLIGIDKQGGISY